LVYNVINTDDWHIMNNVNKVSTEFGMKINVKKTKVMLNHDEKEQRQRF